MANEYYIDICREMEEGLANHNYHHVIERMNEELSMPYIPLAYEERFVNYRKDAMALLATQTPVRKEVIDVETFESLLGDLSLETQLLAVESLRQVNLNPYLEAIQNYLLEPAFDEVQSLLIYELIEQGRREEFKTTKDGFLIDFTPYYLELPHDTDTYQNSSALLMQLIEKNPSLLRLCEQILQVLFMKRLPLSYDDDEVTLLCASIIHYACEAMEDDLTWQQVKSKLHVQESQLMEIVLD